MFFQTTVVGFIGQDAELRTFQGDNFVTFSIDNTQKYKDKETTVWINCTTKKEELLPYLKRGTQVLVTGAIRAKAYLNKDNEAQAALELSVKTLDFLSSKKEVETPAEVGE